MKNGKVMIVQEEGEFVILMIKYFESLQKAEAFKTAKDRPELTVMVDTVGVHTEHRIICKSLDDAKTRVQMLMNKRKVDSIIKTKR